MKFSLDSVAVTKTLGEKVLRFETALFIYWKQYLSLASEYQRTKFESKFAIEFNAIRSVSALVCPNQWIFRADIVWTLDNWII